jgi:hypothetical protein
MTGRNNLWQEDIARAMKAMETRREDQVNRHVADCIWYGVVQGAKLHNRTRFIKAIAARHKLHICLIEATLKWLVMHGHVKEYASVNPKDRNKQKCLLAGSVLPWNKPKK